MRPMARTVPSPMLPVEVVLKASSTTRLASSCPPTSPATTASTGCTYGWRTRINTLLRKGHSLQQIADDLTKKAFVS